MTIFLLVLVAVHGVLAACFLLGLLRQRFEPSAMLFWAVTILFVPVLGSVLYARLGENRLLLRAQRKRGLRTRLESVRNEDLYARYGGLPEALRRLANSSELLSGMGVTSGNRVEVLSGSAEILASWKAAIEGAERAVDFLFFTWAPDETGKEMRDLVCRRAREGVACRVLVDAVGSRNFDERFAETLRSAGVEVAFFLPFSSLKRRWSPHLRNHRKILIVDDRVGFLGSQNIDDYHLERTAEYPVWKDVHLRIEGPAVGQLALVFAEDWVFASERDESPELPAREYETAGDSAVQILATGPDSKERTLERVLLDGIAAAETTIRIATPYFIPSTVLRVALQQAALRGVEIRIVVPAQCDVRLALWAGRSFYAELLSERINVYEFQGGMLHSKVVVVDEVWAMAGTANMDMRSLRLNFEVSALVYDGAVARELAEVVEGYIADSKEIGREDIEGASLKRRILEGAARIFSPQL